MAFLPQGVDVYLYTQPTDMRKSFTGLVALTKNVIRQNPTSGHLFVFVNRTRNYTKALYYSRGGYCLWAKRLEQGRFSVVHSSTEHPVALLSDTQLMMWIDGISLDERQQKKRYQLPMFTPTTTVAAV